jgi:hypothetical protein
MSGPAIEESLDAMALQVSDNPRTRPRAESGGLRRAMRTMLGRKG